MDDNSFIKDVLHRYFPVSDDTVKLLKDISSTAIHSKGTQLLSIGQTSRKMFILKEGAVVSYYLNAEGDTYHKNIFLEGDFVGSMVSALNATPSGFALEVIEEAILIEFNFENFKELVAQNSDLKDFYVKYLEKNWVIDKERREIEIVLKDAGERYRDFIHSHPNIASRIPLHFIASHLGITPTQLSRIRKNLKKSDPNQHM